MKARASSGPNLIGDDNHRNQTIQKRLVSVRGSRGSVRVLESRRCNRLRHWPRMLRQGDGFRSLMCVLSLPANAPSSAAPGNRDPRNAITLHGVGLSVLLAASRGGRGCGITLLLSNAL